MKLKRRKRSTRNRLRLDQLQELRAKQREKTSKQWVSSSLNDGKTILMTWDDATETMNDYDAHDGKHGFDCDECARHMMSTIGKGKVITEFSTMTVSNSSRASKQIRQYLGFDDKIEYLGITHGERLLTQRVKELVEKYSDCLGT